MPNEMCFTATLPDILQHALLKVRESKTGRTSATLDDSCSAETVCTAYVDCCRLNYYQTADAIQQLTIVNVSALQHEHKIVVLAAITMVLGTP